MSDPDYNKGDEVYINREIVEHFGYKQNMVDIWHEQEPFVIVEVLENYFHHVSDSIYRTRHAYAIELDGMRPAFPEACFTKHNPIDPLSIEIE